MDKPMIDVRYSDIMLTNVSFKKSDSFKEQSYQINFADIIKISDVTASSFKLIYERATTQKEPFYVSVVFELLVTMDKKGIDYYAGDLERVKSFANARKMEIVNGVALPSRASLLIGNIVREFGMPLITPPFLTPNSK